MKRAYWTTLSEKQCSYTGLRDWMNYSGVCVSALTRMMYGNESKRKMVAMALKGGNCSKETIDRILKVSGLTYEEAFGKGEKKCPMQRL